MSYASSYTKLMIWDESYETGNMAVDNAHMKLFSLIKDVMDANFSGSKEKIESAIDFLADYALLHFADEEKLMDESEFPGASEHKSQHEAFAKGVMAMKEKINKDYDNLQISTEINRTVAYWLVNHILYSDKLLAKHYKWWQKNYGR